MVVWTVGSSGISAWPVTNNRMEVRSTFGIGVWPGINRLPMSPLKFASLIPACFQKYKNIQFYQIKFVAV
jgi:hypothetical protein